MKWNLMKTIIIALIVGIVSVVPTVNANEHSESGRLYIGGATVDITPDRPVPLSGQMHTRISTEVESPLTATALALESKKDDAVLEQAIFVSVDIIAFNAEIYDGVRERIVARIPDFDPRKLILSATHTHTAPVFRRGRHFEGPPDNIMQPDEYLDMLIEKLADVSVEAWEARAPGQVGWGLGHAVIAHNRRAVFADGRSVMYGHTGRGDFRHIEGYSDHNIDALFFWDNEDKLIATAINVACPAQEVEGRWTVNADFWHETREELRRRHGEDLLVLGWTGASGDQVSRPMYYTHANERMRNLRGVTRLEEIARRLVNGWTEAYEGARQEKHASVIFQHAVDTIELPRRTITDEEYKAAQERLKEADEGDTSWAVRLARRTMNRYENPTVDSTYAMDINVVRLGDVAIATNDFELFTDFGTRIKARSKALQTFILQLSGPGGSYLPTERANQGGGYGAESTPVGSDGGQVLVRKTLALIEKLWKATE